jgi:L-ascorbate metabolism protein UlaG (beta-lactamase superfamily)
MPVLIPAFQKNEILKKDIQNCLTTEGVHIWWLGQSGFLLVWQGKCLLFDPYLSDSLTVKYADTDKPHTRMSEMAIDPAHLDMVNIVTSSHNHTDHLDADTLMPLFKANPNIQFIIPEANRTFVCNRLQCDSGFPVGLNDGQHIDIQGFKILGVPAAHNTIERDELGRCKFMGYVVQFGNYAVYHSGDTLWYDGMVGILKPFKVNIAFLPINGNRPERRVAGNLNYEEAARLGKAIDAQLVIPHHYDMFEFNTENPDNFIKKAEKYGQPYRVLRIGERLTIV